MRARYNTNPEILTPEEAGQLLSVTNDTIVLLCRKGIIPHYRDGRYWRIPKEELRRWAEERGIQLGKDELLQLNEVAAITGMSKKKLQHYMETGKLPVVTFAKRGWRFVRKRDLEIFLKSLVAKKSARRSPHTPLGPNGDINILARKTRRRKKPRKWSLYGEVREAIRQVLGHDPPPEQVRACLKAWKIRREGLDGLAALAAEKIIAIWREVLQKVSPRRKPKITLLWILYRYIPRLLRRIQERFEQALERYRRGGQPEWTLPRLPGEQESPQWPPLAPNPGDQNKGVDPAQPNRSLRERLIPGFPERRREAPSDRQVGVQPPRPTPRQPAGTPTNRLTRLRDAIPQALLAGRQEAQANIQEIPQEIPQESTPPPPKSFRDLFPADFLAKMGKSHAHRREISQKPAPGQSGGMVQARDCLRDAIPPEILAKIGKLKPETA